MGDATTVIGKAVRGAGWTILTGVGSRALSLFGTLALTHYLTPEVQGEVADAYIFVLTPHWATTSLVQYLVAKPKAGRDEAWHVTVAHLGIGVVVLAAAVLLAQVSGNAFKAPEMARYAPGFAVALLLERIGAIPERVLARDLRFRALAIVRAIQEITYSVSVIAFAALGTGGMAIVYGNIARGLVYCGLLVALTDWRTWLTPAKLQAGKFGPILRYGLPLWVSYLAVVATRRWDKLAISNLYGPAVMGAFNLAYNLADVPALQVAEQIGDVFMPSLAHLSAEEKKSAIVRATGLLAIIVFPLAVGLGAVAPTIVEALLRPEWHEVGPMLAILAAVSVTRPIAVSVVGPYLQVTDRTRASMILGFVQIALLMGCLYTLGRVSPLWACAAVGVAFGLYSLVGLAFVQAFDGVRVTAFLARCGPPLLACVPMVLAVLGARAGLLRTPLAAPKFRLGFEVAAGAVGYIAGAFVLAPKMSRELIETVRDARRKRHGSDPG